MSTCIITGASSGIGRATAIEIAKRDDYSNLVLIARSEKNLQETIELIGETEKVVEAICFDMGETNKIEALIDGIYEKYGSIDVLINCAGYTEPTALLDTTLENFEKTYTVNVFSVFMLIKECVKYMKHNGYGKIINVASTAGITPRPGWLSYASSKAAVISMSSTLSSELAEYGIKVYCVSPGRCATALRRTLAPDEDQSKIMQPEMVAEVMANLTDKDERCLDGQNIVIRMLQ